MYKLCVQHKYVDQSNEVLAFYLYVNLNSRLWEDVLCLSSFLLFPLSFFLSLSYSFLPFFLKVFARIIVASQTKGDIIWLKYGLWTSYSAFFTFQEEIPMFNRSQLSNPWNKTFKKLEITTFQVKMATLAIELLVGQLGLWAMAWNTCSSADLWKSQLGTWMFILCWDYIMCKRMDCLKVEHSKVTYWLQW